MSPSFPTVTGGRCSERKAGTDFAQRLSDIIVELPPRRRQALIMLLFALIYEQLTPDDAEAWLDDHDVDSADGIEAMISWLRQFRSPQPPPDLT